MVFKSSAVQKLPSSKSVIKAVVFTLLVFVTAMLQSSFFGMIEILSVTPDILLGTVTAIAMLEGEKAGAIYGMIAGFFQSCLCGTGTAFMPLFLMLIGYFSGFAVKNLLTKNFPSWLVYMLATVAIREMISVLYFVFTENSLNIFLIFTKIIIPETFATIICSVPFYGLVKLCGKPFNREMDFDEAE